MKSTSKKIASLSKIILLSLSFSFLNPAAILDAIVIIGGSANHFEGTDKLYFIAGTMMASLVWFITLATTTKFMAKKITNNKVWQVLDIVSGGLMLIIATKFILELI